MAVVRGPGVVWVLGAGSQPDAGLNLPPPPPPPPPRGGVL